jgi:C4-dicarboxylate transporter DctQ subunit
MSASYSPKTPLGRAVHAFEETAIAVILGLMTILTLINVILRYGFQSGLSWALEAVSFLFAWLVLFGIAYAVKVTAHLGVDAITGMLAPRPRRILALVAAACCLIYAGLLMKGAWDYWANFANLPQTTGRWFPTGFEEMKRTSYRGWYEVLEVPMPDWLRWLEPLMNDGDTYEKMPRFIPYAILPIGMALLLFRFLQASWAIVRGTSDSLIVSHEAEDAVEDVRHMNYEE